MYMLNERQRVKPCIEFQLVYFELALDFGYILNYSKNHKLMLHFKHPSLLLSFYLADKKIFCSILLDCSSKTDRLQVTVAVWFLVKVCHYTEKVKIMVQILTFCSETKTNYCITFANFMYHRNKSCRSPLMYGSCAHVLSRVALS